MKNPQISFIVSAYNRPESLKLCLHSLRLQTYPDWEAIVVDRADTIYNSSVHAGSCLDQNITYVSEMSPNKYYSCETGAKIAKGEWLCFPSDDSYYVPQFAARMIKCGEDNEADLVYCDLVHGHHDTHNFLSCYPRVGQIDKTNFIIRRSKMEPFSMKDINYELSDGYFIESVIKHGAKVAKLSQLLVVHN